MPLISRSRNLFFALRLMPGLITHVEKRALFQEMFDFAQQLPAIMTLPLPHAMTRITPTNQRDFNFSHDTLRDLADLATLIDRRNPLGICLRRSLVRYHFLRQARLNLGVHFGARFKKESEEGGIGGHAWTVLEGQPYFEADENWRDFRVMLRWPQD